MLIKRYESTEVDHMNLATCALGDSLVPSSDTHQVVEI